MTDAPEEVIDHNPEVCSGCGAGLGEADVTGTTRRQVFELPAPAPVVPEHRAQTRRCGCYGKETTASFPDAVRAPVSYGPRVRAIVVYLLARQHVPTQRAAEAMAELFGIELATGTVDAVYAEAARASAASSPLSSPGCGPCRCCTRTRPRTGSGQPRAGCTSCPPGSTPWSKPR